MYSSWPAGGSSVKVYDPFDAVVTAGSEVLFPKASWRVTVSGSPPGDWPAPSVSTPVPAMLLPADTVLGSVTVSCESSRFTWMLSGRLVAA